MTVAAAMGKQILEDDSLVAILRTHIHLDAMLGELILLKFPQADIFIGDKTTFARKVSVSLKLGIITQDLRNALTEFNKLRNEFAHDLEERKLTATDDDTLPLSFGEYQSDLWNLFRTHIINFKYFSESPGTNYKSRMFMLTLYMALRDVLSAAKP